MGGSGYPGRALPRGCAASFGDGAPLREDRREGCVRVHRPSRFGGRLESLPAGGSADAGVRRCLTVSARSPSLAWVTCRVVCISHATGAGGEEVGRLVAEQLGFLYVDDDIVARAAARGEISPAEVADEERRKSLVSRLLEALAEGSSDLGGSVVVQGLDNDDVRALIRETIERTAARGNAVIVAHAASYVVEPGDEPSTSSSRRRRQPRPSASATPTHSSRRRLPAR